MIGKWFSRKDRASPPPPVTWPKLPEAGFLSGRSAKVGDVDRGEAVFSQRTDDGFLAEPYPIDIPQYANWRDEDGTKIPVIVFQAERHIADKDGDPIFGLRGLDGESIVATAPEVELLGTAIPRR
jgi:hypothetical protein